MASYPTKDAGRELFGALIAAVAEESPAWEVGFEPGCRITHVDGRPLRDIIDWRWLSCGDEVELGYIDLDGEAGTVVLVREEGESWGIEFDGVVFDGVKQCRNACTFCFMRMLPDGMRPSLTVRDDDFRLSFLAGTFVTLTNLSADDEARIVEQRIAPLRVSLHAADADVRRVLIGKHAAHGLAAFDRLLSAGIEAHAQIVLVPGVNDGDVLRDTLEWAYARPGIANVGIVPLGFTKHQSAFSRSFNAPDEALAVLRAIESFQARALAERGTPWVFAADEFYRNAYGADVLDNLPPSSFYGDFSLFEDGIGIIRSYVDDWRAAGGAGVLRSCADALMRADVRARFVVGGAMQPFLDQLVAKSGIADAFALLTVENGFFGGNVDVTGLLCGCDIAAALAAALDAEAASGGVRESLREGGRTVRAEAAAAGDAPLRPSPLFCVPSIVFNDDGVTLDGMDLQDIERAAGVRVHVVSCNPTGFFPEIERIAARIAAEQ